MPASPPEDVFSLAIVVDNSSFETPLRPVAATARGKVIHRRPELPWWADEVLPKE